MSAHTTRGVILFRSYISSENQAPDCTIIQAVRATTAHPGLFKPANIEDRGITLSFIDAGLGCNNPAARMLDEAKLVFQNQHVGCVISVGTGQTQPPSLPAYKRISRVLSDDSAQALQRIATDCEQTAQQLQVRFRDTPNTYFRFNIEQGLQDIGAADLRKLPEVVAHARNNNQLVEVSTKLNNAAKAAVSGGALVPVAQIDGAITLSTPKAQIKNCPPTSIIFTGRKTVLSQIEEYFMGDPRTSVQHVFVLHGLGGSGKTQIALKFIETHRDAFWNVFYIDASSAEAISTDLKAIALAKGVGATTDDTLKWLAGQDKKWLMVFNDADDTSLDLQQYFPVCLHGDILITTRNRQMIKIAGETKPGVRAERQVSTMPHGDAKKLLLRASGMATNNPADNRSAIALAKELGCLALAIIQAGAYIQVNECTLEEYLEMFRKNKLVLEEFLKIKPKHKDYRWTVYTTWRISYDQLEGRVSEFLRLLGFLHREGITESMFQNACERLSSYPSELICTPKELAIKQELTEFLKSGFCAADGSFSKPVFLDFIRELRSYSLIDFNPFDRTYSIHSLLQDWVRRMAVEGGSTSRFSTALLLALSIRYESDSLSRYAMKRLLPHVDTVLINLEVMPCTANAFAWVYQENDLWKEAGNLLKLALTGSKRMLGETHATTIYNVENLAVTLSRQDRWAEAEMLRQQAIEACEIILGAEHAHTLWAMSNLALHYAELGRFQNAEDLQLRVVEAKKRAIGATHTDTLQAAGNLAIVWADSGQLEKARRLQESIHNAFTKSAGPQHPDTLTSMQHLAITLARERRWDESTAMLRAK
ncbi:hypothetical protein FRC09_006729 [Ceratobasidium sp. 395]|nr:hypothetical protein FRC09_006729 [Ceratobasidium sp. 395]